MSRKATLDALFAKRPAPEVKSASTAQAEQVLGAPNNPAPAAASAPAADPPAAARIRSGAIGAMGASLQQLKASAGEVESLRQALAAGETVAELDPALIDSAPVADRFHVADDRALAELVESIRASGQQVPVLVRPHPVSEGRWQAAYGHRRIRAASALGVRVKAIVRPLTDEALAVAQGKENLERRDLTFIEKAFFASGLEQAGFSRATLCQALSADKADVSRYIAVARDVPETLARLIGPAPKAGRARWIEVAAAAVAAGPRLQDVLAALPQLEAFTQADSDARLRIALARLAAKPPAPPAPPPLVKDAAGRPVAVMAGSGAKRRIDLNETLAPGFAAVVAEALPALYARWRKAQASAAKPNPEE